MEHACRHAGKLHAGRGGHIQVLYCLRYSIQATVLADVHEELRCGLTASDRALPSWCAGRAGVATANSSTPN